MIDELLTVEETAAKLKLNTDTIRRMLRDHQLPGVKLGKREWRVSSKALQEYVEKGGDQIPRDEPLPPATSRKLQEKAARDPKWKNKTTGAKKLAPKKGE